MSGPVEVIWAAIAFVAVWLAGLHFLVSRQAERTERERRRRWWEVQ